MNLLHLDTSAFRWRRSRDVTGLVLSVNHVEWFEVSVKFGGATRINHISTGVIVC